MDQIEPDADPTERYGDMFLTVAEWLGARFQLRGAKALKATLAELTASPRCYREMLWEPAIELLMQGMSRPAVMVRDASLQCPSLIEVAAWRRESGEPIPTPAGAERRVARYRKQAEQLLHQIGLDLEWLGEQELSRTESAELIGGGSN
jgi:hypothetical protein